MDWLNEAILALTNLAPPTTFFSYRFNVVATLAILLTCLICGSVGGLVVGNRMAFFSDALAHCSFAGVSLGLLVFLLFPVPPQEFQSNTILIMISFGVVIGVLIAYVRERTNLASDTVIGVFFAFSIGLGAVFSKLVAGQRAVFNIEAFMFGDPLSVQVPELVFLALVFILTVAFLVWAYNDLVLTSVHPSLALSRNVRVRLLRYIFIILLGIQVNLCLWVVGTLLINGLLIVPAATASNLTRNLRQLFWWTLALTLVSGLGGQWLSWEMAQRFEIKLSNGGTIVVLCSTLFFLSMALRPWLRGRTGIATST